jgi:hypothetical protein
LCTAQDDKRVHEPGTTNRRTTEVFLEPITIGVISYDALAAVATGHEVVDGVRILKAQSSRHPRD